MIACLLLQNMRESLFKLTCLFNLSRWVSTVNLSHNALVELPPAVGHMKSLKTLYLQNNRLSELPKALGEKQLLKTLDVTENELTDLPDDLRKWRTIEVLLLGRNQLSQMPKSFRFLEMLHTFDITGNNFVSFALPDGAGHVLRNLKLAENPWRLPPPGGEDNKSLITKIHRSVAARFLNTWDCGTIVFEVVCEVKH